MITIQNKSNRNLYMDYFAEVSEASGLDITCLEDVFGQIAVLRANEDTKRFTRLPLDEEPFEIDLDTRVITVPSSFSKNGVSVKGDVISETIYFKCYRYYDNVDLAGTEVYIQYTNADGQEKIAPASMVDIESEPGYMLIEWPISGIAAAAAGNLKFAVRFCEFDDNTDELLYSLATLTQTVKINDSLDFDFKNGLNANNVENGLGRLMLARLEDNNIDTLPSIVKASNPEYVISLTAGVQNLDAQDETGKLTLTVSAINDEGGTIAYYLYKDGEKVMVVIEDDEVVPAEFTLTYVPVNYSSPKTGVCYYTKADDEEEYTKVGDVETFEADTKYFEQAFSIEVNSTGEYYITATNRVRMTITDEIQTPEDGIITIPAATQVEAPIIANRAYTDGENELDGTQTSPDTGAVISYQWYKDDAAIEGATEAKYAVTEDGTYKVVVNNYLNKTQTNATSNESRVTALPQNPVLTFAEVNSKNYIEFDKMANANITVKAETVDASRIAEDSLTYQWYKFVLGKWSGDSDREKSIEDALNGEYLEALSTTGNDIKLEGATSDTLTEGFEAQEYYYCLITNTYNGKSVTISSPFFRVENAE